MTEWLEESLSISISEMRELGLSSVADDLGRLLSSGSLADIQLYRNLELAAVAEVIDDIGDVVDLKVCLHQLADVLRVDHMTLHCCSAKATNSFSVRVITTYPKSWVEEYVRREFSNIDPILARAENAPVGFYWDSIDYSFPLVAEFRAAAIEAGIGPSGFTLPVAFDDDIRLACTVTSCDSPDEFRDRFSKQEHDLRLLMEALGDVFFRVAGRVRVSEAALEMSMVKVLLALARGKSIEDVCRALSVDVDGMTARILESYDARTLAQALALSIRAGHLDEWPFDLSEVQH